MHVCRPIASETGPVILCISLFDESEAAITLTLPIILGIVGCACGASLHQPTRNAIDDDTDSYVLTSLTNWAPQDFQASVACPSGYSSH